MIPSDLVFLYGTLKRGFPNSEFLPTGVEFVDEATTHDAMHLSVGRYGIPYLLPSGVGSGLQHVHGEVFRVDRQALATLDGFEGVGQGFYDRVAVVVMCKNQERRNQTAWCYVRSAQNSGPEWAREDTLETLARRPSISEYTRIEARAFVARNER